LRSLGQESLHGSRIISTDQESHSEK
jgi:hypothetical protein